MDQHRIFTFVKLWVVVVGIMVMPKIAAAKTVLLGPANRGAENGADDWYYGTNGAAWVSVDDSDPATGQFDFTIGNNTAGHENRADWRSKVFPLGPAADGAEPITFSFAYKFPDRINGRDNMQVFLRFFDATGTNFFSQRIFRIGFHTGDSNMVNYKTLTVSNIRSPREARTADVWVTANIWEPWTSGIGRFDDFSVETVSRVGLTILLIFASLVTGLMILVIVTMKSRRKNRGAGAYNPHRKR